MAETLGSVDVEIRARLDMLEKDLAAAKAQLDRFDQERVRSAQNSGAVMKAAFSGVQSQLVAMAAGMGPVGVALSALGPQGLAAAAGINEIFKAVNRIDDQAKSFGDWSSKIVNVGEASKFGTATTIALGRAASDVGVNTEKAQFAMQRFALTIANARNGTGPLADALRRINYDLLLQLESTKDNAQAWDVLAEAYVKAGRNPELLRQSGFGRNAGQIGLVMSKTHEEGGLVAKAEREDVGLLSAERVEGMKNLRDQLQAAKEDADLLSKALWPSEVLDREKQTELAAKNLYVVLADQAKGMTLPRLYIEDYYASIARSLPMGLGKGLLEGQKKALEDEKRLRDSVTQMRGEKPILPNLSEQGTTGMDIEFDVFSQNQKKVDKSTEDASQSFNKAKTAYENYASALKGLSGATTLAENHSLALKKITMTTAELAEATSKELGITKEEVQVRASQAEAISYAISLQSAYNTLLGAGASVEQRTSLARAQAIKSAKDIADAHAEEAAKAKVLDEIYSKLPQDLKDAVDASAELAKAKAIGTDALDKQITKLNIETEALNLGTQAAIAYKLVQTRMLDPTLPDLTDKKAEAEAYRKLADTVASTTMQFERLKLQKDLEFQSKTMFLSTEDLQVATQLKNIYGNDIPAALASSEAAQIRFNSRMKEAQADTSSFLNTFVQGMVRGQTATAALAQALQQLGSKLIQKGIDDMTKSLFSNLQGPLASMFGIKSGTTGAIGGTQIPIPLPVTIAGGLPGATGTTTVPGLPGSFTTSTAANTGTMPNSWWNGAPSAAATPAATTPAGSFDTRWANASAGSLNPAPALTNTGGAPQDVVIQGVSSPGTWSVPAGSNTALAFASPSSSPPIAPIPGIGGGNGITNMSPFGGPSIPTTGFSWPSVGGAVGTGNSAAALGPAFSMLGKNETANNADVNAFLNNNSGLPSMDSAQTAWCSAFVKSSLNKVGVDTTGTTAVANSWQKWGTNVKPQDVQPGDVAINTGGYGPNQVGGHVGLVSQGFNPATGQIQTISGNTGGVAAGGGQVGLTNIDANAQNMMFRRALPTDTGTQQASSFSINQPSGGGVPGMTNEATPFSSGMPGMEALNKEVDSTTKAFEGISTKVPEASTSLVSSFDASKAGIGQFNTGIQGSSSSFGTLTAATGTAAAGSTTLGTSTTAAATQAEVAGTEFELAGTKAETGAGAGMFGGLFGHATGGMITGPGSATSDTIPAMLSPGEYIMPAAETRQFGPLLEGIRMGKFKTAPRMADGGYINGAMQNAWSSIPQQTPSAPPVVNLKNVNAFDSAGFLQEALSTREGEKAMLNHVRANVQTYKSALSSN